jgi:hypothetical protein
MLKLKELEIVRQVLRKDNMVAVPEFVENCDDIILKVCIEAYVGDKEAIPDPYLVIMREGINWSALQSAKLLLACNCAHVAEDESACSISSIEEIICCQPCDDDCSVLRTR